MVSSQSSVTVVCQARGAFSLATYGLDSGLEVAAVDCQKKKKGVGVLSHSVELGCRKLQLSVAKNYYVSCLNVLNFGLSGSRHSLSWCTCSTQMYFVSVSPLIAVFTSTGVIHVAATHP